MGLPVRVWAREDDGAGWRELGAGQVVSTEYAVVTLAQDAEALLSGPEPPEVVLTSGDDPAGDVLQTTEMHVARLGSRVTGDLSAVLRLAAPPAVDESTLESPDVVAGLLRGRSPVEVLGGPTGRGAGGLPLGEPVALEPDLTAVGLRPDLFELPLRTPGQVGWWICYLVPWCQPTPPRGRWGRLGEPVDPDPPGP